MTQLMDDTERTWIRRSDALSKLPLSEGFQMLTEEMEWKRLRMEKLLIARVMGGLAAPAIATQADYDRGFVAGMRYAVLDVPQAAKRRLELRERPPEADDEEVEDRWVL